MPGVSSASASRPLLGLRIPPYFTRVLGTNLVITILFATIGGFDRIGETLLEVNAVGFSIWGVAELLRALSRGRMTSLAVLAVAIPAGFLIGGKISALLGTPDFVSLLLGDPRNQWRSIAADLVLACLATGFFVYLARTEALRADLQTERRRSAEALQAETSARLALLQAQIEPHFLFNTLANVESTIDVDPAAARAILEQLNAYLRVSLSRTRRPTATVAEELSLLRALLTIAALRLGARLHFTLSVPPELEAATLPPLLLQPLVENAIRHGIEPSIRGGEIHIAAQRDGEFLRLRVSDSGIGFDSSSPEGVGLGNVRGRLEQLYGERGRLAIFRNEPCGTVVELTLPLEGL
ncbi:MAG: sensor histidine kinase [Steroidobacteraceae bacterium]